MQVPENGTCFFDFLSLISYNTLMSDYLTVSFNHSFELVFKIESTPLAQLWLEKMHQRSQWPLDDPARFYGFNDPCTEIETAERRLRACIDVINSYDPVIQRDFTDINDQDLLNYLHSIFERYHGLLDQQHSEWWQAAPLAVRQALANLNIAVHRAESAARGNRPRFVCTWFGMPKREQFTEAIIQQHGCLEYEFGGVYVNYVEIGKTLEDLSLDDDQWISDDAFRPFLHYSADFNVRFYDQEPDLTRVIGYFEQHRGFFESRGIFSTDDYRVKPYRFKVASLESTHPREHILREIAQNQLITDIYLP